VPLLCVAQEGCSSTAETTNVWPIGLPYEGEVELLEQTGYTGFGVLGGSQQAGSVGFYIECTILGVRSSDECTVAQTGAELTLSGTSAVVVDSEAFTELAGLKLGTCSFAGGETAVLEGSGILAVSGGGELTASSEGVVS
jgi:hypothetical protein